jgi:CO dehydrogenase nickel-insertion accessory protein CooC1
MDGRPLSGLRLGIFGKGGAGKSTVTVLLAGALRRLGYSVLVVDADSTNIGLAKALGIERDPDPLLDYFGGMVFSGGRVTCPVDDPEPLPGASVSLSDLPAATVARNSDGICLLVAGKLGRLGPGAGCDGPIAKIARDLHVTDIGPDDVMLVDYKAGFEDSARGALTSLDWVLSVVDPTTAALQMALHLARMVTEIRAGTPPATEHLERPELVDLAVRLFREARVRGVLAILNRVPDPNAESYLREALEVAGVPVVGVIGEDPTIQVQWLRGKRLGSDYLSEAAARLARGLEAVERKARAMSNADVSERAPGERRSDELGGRA